MRRKDFININAVAVLGISLFPFQTLGQTLTKDFLIGKNNPYLTSDQLMHKTAYKAFLKMHKEALKDNIDIKIVSGFRSFERQLTIWNNKFKTFKNQGLSGEEIIKKITTYSTIPGTSRHHWGTDIDIIDASAIQPNEGLLLEENYHGNGNYCRLHEWMQTHAHKFGFNLVYTDNYHRTGFAYEPWHYSYKPLSVGYLKAYDKIDLHEILKSENILGNKYLDQNCLSSYIESHIHGVNPKLLN